MLCYSELLYSFYVVFLYLYVHNIHTPTIKQDRPIINAANFLLLLRLFTTVLFSSVDFFCYNIFTLYYLVLHRQSTCILPLIMLDQRLVPRSPMPSSSSFLQIPRTSSNTSNLVPLSDASSSARLISLIKCFKKKPGA